MGATTKKTNEKNYYYKKKEKELVRHVPAVFYDRATVFVLCLLLPEECVHL